MEEKIKVYVPENVYSTLNRDADFFEFYKKDRSLNMNDFINTLIVNYFESYHEDDTHLYDAIKNILSDDASDKAGEIITAIKKYQFEYDRKDRAISIKPTRKSSGIIDYIQSDCLYNMSLSAYFRNMFSSYCLLAQDKREEIIFRDKFAVIEKAIEENKNIYFTTSKSKDRHVASPYAIAHSQEELFNYLLCVYNNQVFSFRLTRLQNLRVLNEPAVFTDEQKEMLEKMRVGAPQFAYNKIEEICVRLTERGISMYNKMYSYRPKPIKVIKNLYYFDCSASQIYHYFFRFGRQAEVLYPSNLKQLFMQDYANAARTYMPKKG